MTKIKDPELEIHYQKLIHIIKGGLLLNASRSLLVEMIESYAKEANLNVVISELGDSIGIDLSRKPH